MKTTYSREEKTKRLEEWKQSGKSPRTYARETGINRRLSTEGIYGEEVSCEKGTPMGSKETLPGAGRLQVS